MTSLQQRTKWLRSSGDFIHPSLLILVKEDGVPPLKWVLGKIHKLHPRADRISRVATVKTPTIVIRHCPY